jgi:hydroxyethylthiazole kinase-like uncharacterized protein yjeF
MKLSHSAQMREMDKYTIDVLHVPSILLMTNAAGHVVQAALELLPKGGCAAVFCGSGNNGGDGVGAAVVLKRQGIPVRVFLTGKREKITPDTAEMVRRFESCGGVLEDFNANSPEIREYVQECDVIIDAMFGIGLNANIRGTGLQAVHMINDSPAKVISADIASGVEADTGRVMGDAVYADVTVTFSMAMPGHFVEPGCVRCGALRVVDIGIPRDLQDSAQTQNYAVTGDEIRLPKRRPDTHKGDYGRNLILAGSVGFTGAPVLAARAASRAGAGLVCLGVPEKIYTIAAIKCDEVMPFPLPCDDAGRLSLAALDEIISRLEKCDVCLIGPGLGRSEMLDTLVAAVIRRAKVPVILDADGINAISGNIDVLDEAGCPLILTPHAGEFARLGYDLSDGDRIGVARRFACRHQCILVLKGHRTITAFPDGTAYVNTTGGPGLAKGGSGDILAGMITALIGQKFPVKDAVLSAVYLHGKAGDTCARSLGEYGMTASDVIETLPQIMQ